MLELDDAVLIIVDVQGKLAHRMHRKEALFEQLQELIKGAQVLSVPILWVEQNPKGLGPTIPEIADLLTDVEPIPKLSFSCCDCDPFMQALRSLGRKQILIAGIETHVCVYQTAVDLLSSGYEVQVVSDAVSSRTEENRQIGLNRIEGAGAVLTSTEMALFEMLKVAKGAPFKEIINIVK